MKFFLGFLKISNYKFPVSKITLIPMLNRDNTATVDSN